MGGRACMHLVDQWMKRAIAASEPCQSNQMGQLEGTNFAILAHYMGGSSPCRAACGVEVKSGSATNRIDGGAPLKTEY